MPRKKIALVGGGQIGGILALLLTQHELGNICVIDIPQAADMVKGKALDLSEFRSLGGHDVNVVGSGNLADVEGANVVVITAGVARKPGMTRDNLLNTNLDIIKNIAAYVARYAPDAFVILCTNPLDAMVYAFHKVSGLPQSHVVGMAGALDSARFRVNIAREAGISVEDVSCLVMGGHGPSMVPLTRTATVSGVPLGAVLTQEQIDAVVEQTRQAGTEIVRLLRSGSAFFSPAAAIMEMVEAYVKDRKRVIPSTALCRGEYGIDGYFIGVPCVIGYGGVERILEFDLTPEEWKMLQTTFDAVKANVATTGL